MIKAREIAESIVRKYSCSDMIETHCNAQNLVRDIADAIEKYQGQYNQAIKHHEAWLRMQSLIENNKTFWQRMWG